MQIFVMWIVIQGVGAADKVWQAALSYLNRGGLIINTQMNPQQSISAGSNNEIATGAGIILSGQVCMLGLQTALENQRQNYLNSKQNNSGACSGTPSTNMQHFCDTAVPDFLSSVNVVAKQNSAASTQTQYTVPMPNFTDAPYSALNGICGSITWNKFTGADNLVTGSSSNTSGFSISQSELQTTQFSRAIAIQQMYTDLSMVAQVMVNNDPVLNPQNNNTDNQSSNFSTNAVQQFGVPLAANNQTVCTTQDVQNQNCKNWGSDPTSTNTSSPLFNGTEFQGAVSDYNGIMQPALSLQTEGKKGSDAASERAFIQDANNYGWILAGSYFFDLAKLNSASAMESANSQTDSGTGLGTPPSDQSVCTPTPSGTYFSTSCMQNAFASSGQCGANYGVLCEWMNGDNTSVNQVIGLLDGSNVTSNKLSLPAGSSISTVTGGSGSTGAQTGAVSSTVYGFITNSLMVNLSQQPGQTPPKFTMKFNMNFDLSKFSLPHQDFPCGSILGLCIGRLMGNIFYNLIIKTMFNFFLNIVGQIINMVVMAFLSVPLMGMGAIF
ncbi:defect in organelle trafficking protein DotA [Legionella hackeliae]|nr:defect in organelle trafficking protein DotA [Legionella hackeliae]